LYSANTDVTFLLVFNNIGEIHHISPMCLSLKLFRVLRLLATVLKVMEAPIKKLEHTPAVPNPKQKQNLKFKLRMKSS
jgi:hypothetical protein